MAGIKKENVCVLIPAYNEAANIARVLDEVHALGFHTLVVDDGSQDDTVEKARGSATHILVSNVNQGKGATLRKGFEWFLKQDYQVLILMDADGQHDPKELGSFLQEIDRTDAALIIGNRMHHPQGMPWIRRATNRFLSWVLSVVSDQKVLDSQCGYRAIRREALESISLKTSRFEIESEMILEASRAGFKIGSIPIRSVYQGEKSQIRPSRDTIRFFKFLFTYLFSGK